MPHGGAGRFIQKPHGGALKKGENAPPKDNTKIAFSGKYAANAIFTGIL